MANKLKIYACSGVGSNDGGTYNYWLDNNENILRNTQAVNSLFAKIDANYTQLIYEDVAPARQIELLNNIDLLSVCLFYAQEYRNSKDDLEMAGRVIGSLVAKGLFDFGSLDNKERDLHLDELYDKVAEAIQYNDKYKGDKAFTEWWNENVIARNKVGLTEEEVTRLEDCIADSIAKYTGVGKVNDDWKKDGTLSKYLNQAYKYFLYYFFTEKQLAKLPKFFSKKHFDQVDIYNHCTSLFVGIYGSEEDMINIIRTNITKEYGYTPEKMCAKIASGKQKGVGEIAAIITAIASLITAITPILVAIIGGVINYCQTANANKYKSLREDIAAEAAPDEEDMKGLDWSSESLQKWLPWIAVGVAGLLLFKKD